MLMLEVCIWVALCLLFCLLFCLFGCSCGVVLHFVGHCLWACVFGWLSSSCHHLVLFLCIFPPPPPKFFCVDCMLWLVFYDCVMHILLCVIDYVVFFLCTVEYLICYVGLCLCGCVHLLCCDLMTPYGWFGMSLCCSPFSVGICAW